MFPKLPSQSTVSDRGQLRLQLMSQARCIKIRPVSRNSLLRESWPSRSKTDLRPSLQSKSSKGGRSCSPTATISQSRPSIPPRNWSATIRLPITFPSIILPTFCSAIVARQYSLVMRARANGIHIKPFSLEIPMQVIYPPPETEVNCITAYRPPAI